VAALDVYVQHTGEVSFSASALSQKSLGTLQLVKLHPGYPEMINQFIATDPMRPAREVIDLARLASLNAGRGVVFVDHGWIGGILRHLNELAECLSEEGVIVSRLAPARDGDELKLTTLSSLDLPNLPSVPANDSRAIADLLARLALNFVHIHSLVAHKLENFERLISAVHDAGLRYHLTIHDYAPVCPRITMVDWGGSYCASPSPDHCRTCISKAGTEFGNVDIDDWRTAYGRVVDNADVVMVPDADVEARLRRYVDIKQPILVRPHQRWAAAAQPRLDARRRSPRERVVGVIGAIGPHKGSGVLLAMAGDIVSRKLPLRLKIYGYTDRVELERFDCVELTGRYQEADIDRIVKEDPCDMAFLPSVWPETYSYTLDIALALGLHPVCFDIGAVAARLTRLGVGTLLPLSLVYDVQALNDHLLMITPQPFALQPLGSQAWWGSQARYYGAEEQPRAAPTFAERQAAQ